MVSSSAQNEQEVKTASPMARLVLPPLDMRHCEFACGHCQKPIATGCYCSEECANADE